MQFSMQAGSSTDGSMTYPSQVPVTLLATPTAPHPIELQASFTPTQQGTAKNG